MYRVRLTEARKQELQRRAHEPGVKPRTWAYGEGQT